VIVTLFLISYFIICGRVVARMVLTLFSVNPALITFKNTLIIICFIIAGLIL